MKTLLVFYSRKGLVKRIVDDFQYKVDTDILEIKPARNYQGPLGYLRSRIDSLNRKIPDIEKYDINFQQYDRVIIVGGIWSTNMCGPILSFMKQHKGKIKKPEYIAISKRRIVSFQDIFSGMDYYGNTHFARATAITVKYNRIINIKRF